MPGLIVPHRRPRDAGHDDDDLVSEDASSQSSDSSRSKRARHQPSVMPDSSAELALPDGGEVANGHTETLTHQPGSLVRVKLTNFVTYTSAEFQLGPSLNMIIGPNGTGKSTLVCAICLGLGWGPQHLGRSKDVGEFVKHGAREAVVEIEVAGGPQQKGRNPVIRRTIKRDGNKTTWDIDGKAAHLKDVQTLARSFAIQIDNLCQFLPQDRVVEFAALTPVQLLEQTERAAAPGYMVEWHEDLKKRRADQKRQQADETNVRERLHHLQTRQNAQRADVQRMTDRRNLQQRLHALEKCRPLVKYQAARQFANERKDHRDRAQEELAQLEADVEPSLAAVRQKGRYREQIDRVVTKRRNFVQKATERVDGTLQRLNGVSAEIEQCDRDTQAERQAEPNRRNDIARTEQVITRLTKQREQPPVECNAAEYNERIREGTRRIREVEDDMQRSREAMGERAQVAKDRKGELQRHEKELANLHTQAGQQYNKLKRMSHDSARAWTWLQENMSAFEGRVYGPAIVECVVADARYADAVESAFQRSDYLAFTCTSRNDFKLLQQKLYGDLGLHDVSIRTAHQPLAHWRSPMSAADLRRYELDGWLLDHITGPDPVLSALCDSIRLHQTAVTLQEHGSTQYERLRDSPIQTWVTRKSYHRVVRRREYGPDAVSTTVRQIRPARFWGDQAVDTSAQRDIEQRITELKRDMAEDREAYDRFEADRTRMKDERDNIVREKEDVEREKAAKQRARGEWEALPTKINSHQAKLDQLRQAEARTKETLVGIAAKRCALTLDKGQLCIDYAGVVEMLRKLHVDLLEAELRHLEAASDLAVLNARSEDVQNMLTQRRADVKDLERQHSDAKKAARAKLDVYHKIMNALTPDERRVHGEMAQGMSEQDLEADIEAVTAQISLLHEGNPDAIRDFERRQQEIDRLQGRLDGLTEQLGTLHDEIAAVKQRWEPELDALVAKISAAFSHNFSKIGCAGQVGVHKDDEFDLWAIQIRVKFRDHEQLSILDSHRQSGGERAVSTIFYLMAMQSLARSPFRVVDEINQGMDPRNERMVHERMVDVACKEHTSQYFLVTPKLLHGLKYHSRMKVHCIASGEYMPSDPADLDFSRLMKVALRAKGKASRRLGT